jgi:hypothetical protein
MVFEIRLYAFRQQIPVLGFVFGKETNSTYLYGFPLNSLKTEYLLNNIYKFSSYLTGNTLRLHYKAQPVNAV